MSVPMTIQGEILMKNELAQLKNIERPAVIIAISEARAQGDLSENAEYDAAKEKQGWIEGRIQDLEAKLSNAQVIDPALVGSEGKVVFGATVDIEDLESGQKLTYTIVGEDQADVKLNMVSYVSPIARSLMSKYVGDAAEFTAPGGKREFEILAVRYQ